MNLVKNKYYKIIPIFRHELPVVNIYTDKSVRSKISCIYNDFDEDPIIVKLIWAINGLKGKECKILQDQRDRQMIQVGNLKPIYPFKAFETFYVTQALEPVNISFDKYFSSATQQASEDIF